MQHVAQLFFLGGGLAGGWLIDTSEQSRAAQTLVVDESAGCVWRVSSSCLPSVFDDAGEQHICPLPEVSTTFLLLCSVCVGRTCGAHLPFLLPAFSYLFSPRVEPFAGVVQPDSCEL